MGRAKGFCGSLKGSLPLLLLVVRSPDQGPPPVGFTGSSDGIEAACDVGDPVRSLGWQDPLEKGMATHSSILAWRIPWTEEPGRLHSPWGHKSQTQLSN